MRLWSPHDPYGVAILRKVLLGASLGLVVYGLFAMLVRDMAFLPFLLAASITFVLGIFVEWTISLFDRKKQ